MRRLSHTKDFSGAAAWCRGYFQQGEREWNRKISIAGVTWHLDAQPNGMLWIFARCVCRRMGTEIGRDQLGEASKKKTVFFFQKNSEILRPPPLSAIWNGRVFSDKEILELARPPPHLAKKSEIF